MVAHSNLPVIIPRSEHAISRADICEPALKVLYRLNKSGYQAYLVGGGVRDLLLGREPKDFDVATDASPDEVRKVFRNCRLIGRRFRLAHVHFGRDIIEVATFRAPSDPEADGDRHIEDDGRILRDNIYGTIDDDAWRRDFTVNALYYNIADFSVLDYTGGMADLEKAELRLIGDPDARYREDPVRMLRAVRFAAKLGFRIHESCEKPIAELANLLEDIPAARIYDELLKLFMSGVAEQTLELLRQHQLFAAMFPQTDAQLQQADSDVPLTFLAQAMRNTDLRIQAEKPVTPAFLFAAILWEPVRKKAEQRMADGMSEIQALQVSGDEIVREQVQRTSIPKRFSFPMRDIWVMQARLKSRHGKRAFKLLEHPKFRAGYDFLLLRAQAGECEPELADWWTRFQEVKQAERVEMVNALGGKSGGGGKRRRRRRKPKRDA